MVLFGIITLTGGPIYTIPGGGGKYDDVVNVDVSVAVVIVNVVVATVVVNVAVVVVRLVVVVVTVVVVVRWCSCEGIAGRHCNAERHSDVQRIEATEHTPSTAWCWWLILYIERGV